MTGEAQNEEAVNLVVNIFFRLQRAPIGALSSYSDLFKHIWGLLPFGGQIDMFTSIFMNQSDLHSWRKVQTQHQR